MNVLGLTGFAGAGKSTAANYLVERHGFTRVSFAAPLKKMLRTLDPIMGRPPVWWGTGMGDFRLSDLWKGAVEAEQDTLGAVTAEGWIKESPWGDEYRRLLQVLGTDCVRAEQEDFWIRAAERQIIDAPSTGQTWGRYVFDDCRFPNEAEFIRSKNPMGLWCIERAGYGAVNGHVSEKHAGNMGETVWLWNGNDLESLHDQIDNAVDMVFQGVKA